MSAPFVPQEAGERVGGRRAPDQHPAQAGEVRLPAGLDGLAEGGGHQGQVPGGGQGGVGHNGRRPHLHGLAGLGGPADARVHDDGQVDLVDENLDEVPGGQALVGADGGRQGHHRRGAGVHQVPGRVQIRVHVGQDDEALLGQGLRGPDGLVVVRQQVFGVVHDLDLHEVAAAQLPGQAGDAHRLVGVPGPGGVGQQGDALGDVVQDVLVVLGVGPADRQGDDLRPRVPDGGLDELQGVFPGAQDKAGRKGVPADDQLVVCLLCCLHGDLLISF